MSIYFDFKTINELTGDNYYRKQKEFTVDELEQYDGKDGNPTYVAIEGIVYDVSNEPNWKSGTHYGLNAGRDLTDQFSDCHGMMDILSNLPKVGVLADNDLDKMNYMNDNSNMSMNRCFRQQQDTSKFTPDDWIRYITPLVTYGLREPNQGSNTQSIYQKIILLGVLVGLGRTPQEAINQVQEWQNTGASKLLKGGTGTGTTGTGTGGGLVTGGSGVGTGAGTGTGTSGGFGTGGTGTGTGAGTSGGFGTGGTGIGTGAGTSGGFGTGGTGSGTGAGTSGGFGTGGTGTGTGAGTSGGFGTGGTGTSTGAGTGTGTTGGIGTAGGAGTTRKGESGTRDRLYFD